MSEISVVMAAYNAEKYVADSIESVLKQSFADFELIIVNDGSTDSTLSVIRSFKDERIKLIENKHDFIGSLNRGMNAAKGKYIARMDADDIMHVDRLKIEYTIMEEEPDITVCSSWMALFNKEINTHERAVRQTVSGILNSPLLHLLKNNLIVNPTSMIRHDFIKTHSLRYEYYDHAEDYKWWVEMAKLGATFYIEPQPLLYYRISNTQVTCLYKEKMKETSTQIKKEILNYLISINKKEFLGLSMMLDNLYAIKADKLMSDDDIFEFIYNLFIKNKNILKQNEKSILLTV